MSDRFEIAASDPYFHPEADGPNRPTPFLDGSYIDPTKPVTPPPENQPVTPQPENTNSNQEIWKAPDSIPSFQTENNNSSIAELEIALKMRSDQLLGARDHQRGTDASIGLIAGTASSLLSEPLARGLRLPFVAAEGSTFLSRAWKNGRTGFLTTFVTGLVMGSDEALRERIYGEHAKSWGSTSLTVPLALTFGKGPWGKSLLTTMALGGGHLIDAGLPAPDWVPDALKHFTAFDGIAIALAATLPSKSKIARLGMMGMAWAAGNVAEATLSGPSTGEIEKIATDAVAKDRSERSYSSMTDAVSKYRDLARTNEIVLEQDFGLLHVDVRRNYDGWGRDEKLGSYRNMLAITKALGEHHLDAGNRLSVTETSNPTYLLQGMDLDLGADALDYLFAARDSVRGSKTLTDMLMGTIVSDSRVKQQELQDLDQVGADVNKSIDSILGHHDIRGAVDKLVQFIDKGTVSPTQSIFNKEGAFFKTFYRQIDEKLGRNLPLMQNSDGTPNQDAIAISAKLMRDQALAEIAFAQYSLAGGDTGSAASSLFGIDGVREQPLGTTGQMKKFDGALQTLEEAEKLDPNNPDLPELKALAKELAEQYEIERTRQLNEQWQR